MDTIKKLGTSLGQFGRTMRQPKLSRKVSSVKIMLLTLTYVASLCVTLFAQNTQAMAAPALPAVMTSAGDSITRGFDVASGCFLKDCPQYSWATGSSTTVNSQLARIKVNSPTTVAYNVAKTGAMMKDLNGQVTVANSYAPQYLTILMGANDVCTSSIATMTPTATFSAQFEQALANFTVANPNAVVSVSSIPNIYNLWKVLNKNRSATSTWSLFGVCKSMLARTNTEAQRQSVLAQLVADNNALAAVCAKFVACKYDGGAVFNTAFVATDISTLDYFHPNVNGQKKLAAASWASSYWAAGL